MGFPVSPTNGQQATVNGVIYTYVSATGVWSVTTNSGANVSANNISSTATVTVGTSLAVLGSTSLTGNATVANVSALGAVSAVGNVIGGNVNTAGLMLATGNITGGNVNAVSIVSAGGNIQGGNLRTVGLVSATGNVTGGNVNGFVRPTAGTATVPALSFVSGTNMTTAGAGAFEYDGAAFYATPSSSNRGVLNTTHFMVLAVDYLGTDSSAAQKVFNLGTGSAGAITLPASTSYFMEATYYITRSVGGNSHDLSTLFALGAALTSITYTADTTSTTGNTLGAVSRIYSTAATAVAVTAASSSTTENITVVIRGIVRTNTSTTFTPQVKYDVAPGGDPTFLAGSFIRLTPIGSSAVTFVGNW